jgi:hypothetical protein
MAAGIASKTTAKAFASWSALGGPALRAAAAERRGGLGRQAHVTHHRDSRRDDRPYSRDLSGSTALELDGVGAGLLDEALRGTDRLLVGGLIGAEGEIGDEQRAVHAAPRGGGQHQHLLDGHRDRGVVAEDDLGTGVADEHDVGAGGVDDLAAREVVGGDHHDRLAQALLLGQAWQGHGQPPGVGVGVGLRCR